MSKEISPIKEVIKSAANVAQRATGIQAFLQSEKDANFPERYLERIRHRVFRGLFQAAFPAPSESYSQEVNGKPVFLSPKEVADVLITAGTIVCLVNGGAVVPILAGKAVWNAGIGYLARRDKDEKVFV